MVRQYITAFVVCAALLLAAGNASYAQDVSIAVVDVEKVLNDSRAGKSIQAQLTARREAFQKEFASRENKLVEAEKKLIEEKAEMPADEFATKRREFEQQLLETRNLFQKRRNSLDKGLNGALTDLRKNIIQVTAEVADEKDYKVVLTRDSVVIVEKEMDITETVLKRLDAKIQTIKLDVAK